MLKTYQFKTHCKGDSHSSKTSWDDAFVSSLFFFTGRMPRSGKLPVLCCVIWRHYWRSLLMADIAVMNINEAAIVSPRVFNFVELWDR